MRSTSGSDKSSKVHVRPESCASNRGRLHLVWWVGLALALIVAIPGPTAIAEDLRWGSEVTYTPDLQAGNVHVRAEMTFTNLRTSTTSGNVVTSYYYDRISFYIPDTAVDVTTISGGANLDHDVEATDIDGVAQIDIGLGRRLLYQQSITIMVEFDVPGDPPRSPSVFRVNEAYVNFSAIGWGDPGAVTLYVVLPKEFLTFFGGVPYTFDVEGDQIVYRFEGLDDPETLVLEVQAWDDDRLAVTSSGLDAYDIVIKSWPNDPSWSLDVLDAVDTGLPVLQELVGLDWRPERTLNIYESQQVSLAGYAGWYLGLDEEIHIAEWVDPHLVLHELSHTWFNENLFKERWITEGLADEFAAEAVTEAGMTSTDYPRPTRAPSPYPGSYLLNDWDFPGFDVDDVERYERFGYDTSFWVMQQLASEIGHDSLAAVIAGAAGNEIAYRSGEEIETVEDKPDDWRRFLDLVEEVGGSEKASDLFAEFVTDLDLSERADARESYQVLRESGWDVPFYVRSPMEHWDFEVAGARIAEAIAVVDLGEQIRENAGLLHVDRPTSLQNEYETAGESLDTIALIAQAQLDTSEHVLAAQAAIAADRDLFEWVGLLGSDPEGAGETAVEAFGDEDLLTADAAATTVIALIDEAHRQGVNRIPFGVGGLVVVVGLGLVLVMRKREPKPGDTRYVMVSNTER